MKRLSISSPSVQFDGLAISVRSNTRQESIIYCSDISLLASIPDELRVSSAFVENNLLDKNIDSRYFRTGFFTYNLQLNDVNKKPIFLEIVKGS